MGKHDVICPLAVIAFGFRKLTRKKDLEVRATHIRLRLSRPLSCATFEPHVVAVYANSAQVLRQVHASAYKRGGRVTSTSGGRLRRLQTRRRALWHCLGAISLEFESQAPLARHSFPVN